jgi:hypothetical protein
MGKPYAVSEISQAMIQYRENKARIGKTDDAEKKN